MNLTPEQVGEELRKLAAYNRCNGVYENVSPKHYVVCVRQWFQPHMFCCRSLDEARCIALEQLIQYDRSATARDVHAMMVGAGRTP